METQVNDTELDDWDDRIGDLWSLNERERKILNWICFTFVLISAIASVAIIHHVSKQDKSSIEHKENIKSIKSAIETNDRTDYPIIKH